MNGKKLGKFGENVAEKYLRSKKFRILGKNYSRNWSSIDNIELDIIAEKDRTIHFIEVKTSKSASSGFFHPEDRAGWAKQAKTAKLAQIWLNENKFGLDTKYQIDIISVVADMDRKKAKIRHFKNIFES